MIPARRFAIGTAFFFVAIFLVNLVLDGDSAGRAALTSALATLLWAIFMYFWGARPTGRED